MNFHCDGCSFPLHQRKFSTALVPTFHRTGQFSTALVDMLEKKGLVFSSISTSANVPRKHSRKGGHTKLRLPQFRRVSRGLELRRTKNVFTSRHVIHFYSTVEYVLLQHFVTHVGLPLFHTGVTHISQHRMPTNPIVIRLYIDKKCLYCFIM
jgi:hypothetical protein